jgi:hypothetical protein
MIKLTFEIIMKTKRKKERKKERNLKIQKCEEKSKFCLSTRP